MGCGDEKLSKYLTQTFTAHCHAMICQQVTLSGDAEWPKVADAVIEAKLLKAKIAVALHDELGRVPKEEEINQVFLLTRVMYKAVLGLHFKRQEQKKNGQLAIF
jgi:hypothetical protein